MPGLPDTTELNEQKLRRYADVVVSALEEGKGTPPWDEGDGPQSNESVQASALLARAIQAHSPAEQELLLSRISENLNVTGGDPTGAESIYHTVQALNAAASAMRNPNVAPIKDPRLNDIPEHQQPMVQRLLAAALIQHVRQLPEDAQVTRQNYLLAFARHGDGWNLSDDDLRRAIVGAHRSYFEQPYVQSATDSTLAPVENPEFSMADLRTLVDEPRYVEAFRTEQAVVPNPQEADARDAADAGQPLGEEPETTAEGPDQNAKAQAGGAEPGDQDEKTPPSATGPGDEYLTPEYLDAANEAFMTAGADDEQPEDPALFHGEVPGPTESEDLDPLTGVPVFQGDRASRTRNRQKRSGNGGTGRAAHRENAATAQPGAELGQQPQRPFQQPPEYDQQGIPLGQSAPGRGGTTIVKQGGGMLRGMADIITAIRNRPGKRSPQPSFADQVRAFHADREAAKPEREAAKAAAREDKAAKSLFTAASRQLDTLNNQSQAFLLHPASAATRYQIREAEKLMQQAIKDGADPVQQKTRFEEAKSRYWEKFFDANPKYREAVGRMEASADRLPEHLNPAFTALEGMGDRGVVEREQLIAKMNQLQRNSAEVPPSEPGRKTLGERVSAVFAGIKAFFARLFGIHAVVVSNAGAQVVPPAAPPAAPRSARP
ncbi:hypothetical protein NR402_12770 [Acidithiobacillus ferrooxidans]|uniref:hypothetical protein n=1 Tax=Acidithiobacillus ferrooxidans TaxID=920 RepID=UPI00214BE8C9|nr:hypothetical protein [Acidithiobacillus ferrooxidans]MCR2831149.1 hypothetical protein [Acidithiobacillus ferrooxidans]